MPHQEIQASHTARPVINPPVENDAPSEDELAIHTDDPPYQYTLLRQEVELEINFLDKSLRGRSELTIHTTDKNALDEVAIDARDCQIDTDGITIERIRNEQSLGAPTKAHATFNDPYNLLDYPRVYRWNAEHAEVRKLRVRPLARTRENDLSVDDRKLGVCTPVEGALRVKVKSDEPPARILIRRPTGAGDSFSHLGSDQEMIYVISVPFQIENMRDGLQFVGVEPGDTRYTHAYTRHSVEAGTACCIFPCIDDHGSLADWKISIKSPRTLGDALNQRLVTQHRTDGSAGENMGSHVLSEEDKMLEMTAVCSGLLTDEVVDPEDPHKKIMTFESEKPMSVQNIGFAVGPFEHVDLFSEFRTEESDERLGTSALKIHGYCLPKKTEWVKSTCVAMASAADHLALTFSGYPFDSYKLCFVEDMVEDTTPLYSFSFISNRLLYPEDLIDTEYETTRKLVHTLACQWSGIGLLPNTRRDRWVTTGIAYFMTDLFLRRLCGYNEHRFRTKIAVDRLVEEDVNRPAMYDLGNYLHVGDFEREFMDLKAPLVMFILDKRIHKATSGSSSLTQILSRLFTKAKIDGDMTISTKSFRKQCERISKIDLEPFWKQWVFKAGCPRFYVTQKFNKKRLAVEIYISQKQTEPDPSKLPMSKAEFLRRIKEKQYNVPVGEFQHLFTGPITIRIHEADGTPYEHIVEIREDSLTKGQAKFEIPYNTKYKRLKRRREKKAVSAAMADGVTGPEEGFFYCLGDTINTPAEMERYQAVEFDEDIEKKMDAESYEWLRVDTDFEWLCSMILKMEGYMYVSQLQQDRDVAAQEESILRCRREPPHSVVSTVLARTVVDTRYFHGIRTMAADTMTLHATEATNMLGMLQLETAFRDMFCLPGTTTPRPNDFSDKRQYLVQLAIPTAMANIRDKDGQCPMRVKRFILDQLRLNNNSENMFADDFYVASLIKALAKSLATKKKPRPFMNMSEDEVDETNEAKRFEDEALEEIERYLKRDEWTHSYRNVWTIAALDAKQMLMKADVIPVNPLDFVKYLQDTTLDDIRIKAWDALVDLGMIVDSPPLFQLFLCSLSTDRSPYVRDQLMKIFCKGLAAIAFGEHDKPKSPTATAVPTPQPKRPVIISRTPSLKIKSTGSASASNPPGAPRPTPPPPPAPAAAAAAAATKAERPSISISVPEAAAADSIVAQASHKSSSKTADHHHRKQGGGIPTPSPKQGTNKKRKSEGELAPSAGSKRPKTSGKKRKMVTFKIRDKKRLRRMLAGRDDSSSVYDVGGGGAENAALPSIQAKPARKPLPSGPPGAPTSAGGTPTPKGLSPVPQSSMSPTTQMSPSASEVVRKPSIKLKVPKRPGAD